MRKICISTILILWAALVSAQLSFIKIVDANSKEPVAFANVCFEDLVSKNRKREATNAQGLVQNMASQRSAMAITAVGYNNYTDTIMPNQTYTLEMIPATTNFEQVVVTGQYKPISKDHSIYKIDVLNAAELKYKGNNTLSEVLSKRPTIRIQEDNQLGSGVMIQGLSGENVKVLIDGVPVIGRMAGIIDMSQFNLSNVDHIEIVEGPMSVIYGSNALAGAINIITKEQTQKSVQASINSYYESVGVYNVDATLTASKHNHAMGLSGGRNFFDGFSTSSGRNMTWKPKEQIPLNLYYIYSGKKTKLKLSSTFFEENLLDRANMNELLKTAIDNWYHTTRFTQAVNTNTSVNANNSFDWQTSYSIYQRRHSSFYKDLSKLSSVRNGGDTTTFNDYMTRGVWSHFSDDKRISWQSGLDVNYETADGDRIGKSQKDMTDAALYGSLQWKALKYIDLQPGLRYAYNSKYNAPLIWSLNIRNQFSSQWVMRSSVARGFRAPSLKELYLDFVDGGVHNIKGNPNLKAERSYNFNVALNYTYKKDALIVENEISGFYNSIRDNINLALINATENKATYFNVARNTTQGGSFTNTFSIQPWFSVSSGVSVTGQVLSTTDKAPSFNDFVYTTDYTINPTLRWVAHEIQLSVLYKYNGKMKSIRLDESQNVSLYSLKDYHTLDVTLNKCFMKNRWVMGIGCKNILNNTFIQQTGSAGTHSSSANQANVAWGRSYFVRVSYNFSKW